ncbi:MAG: hypothetical protein ACI4I9_06470 [Porcipelethomonas sp.]
MLTSKPTFKMVRKWKRIFDENHESMKPNRKTGAEVDNYFRSKYPFTVLKSQKYEDIVISNILENKFNYEKLPEGAQPVIKTYMTEDMFVGIDLITGFFQVECEDIKKAVSLYDDLFVYRGLDELDLQNCYLVAEYIRLTQS